MLKILNLLLLACCLISVAQMSPICSNSSCLQNFLHDNFMQDLNNKFMKLTKISPIEYTHQESTYQTAHEILQFIFSHLLTPTKIIDEIILTLGKTGWGKSTSINLLDGVKFKINEKQNLEPVNSQDMKTKIGTGKGSTTLFPVYVETKFGKVYDLAGDEETRGMVTEIINSISKMNMGKALSKVKILFMVPASVFSAQGSYGSQFKKYLQSANKLLGGINNYKDNIMVIVTFANRRKTEATNIQKSIKACLDHPDKALDEYKDLILHLMASKRIRLIAEPNYDQTLYSVPNHPEWSMNQFQAISESIRNLLSRNCQESDFSVPYNLKMVQQLTSIMHILVQKVRNQFFVKSNNISLSGIELTFVKNLLKDIRSSKHLNLNDFSIKYQTNSYFNSTQITEVVKQIDFVYQFLNAFQNKEVQFKKDWISTQLEKRLTQIIQQIEKVCEIKTLNLLKTFQTSQIIVKPNSKLYSTILQNLQQLQGLYKQNKQFEKDSQNQSSYLFDDVIEQVYDKTVDQIYEIDEVYLQNVTQKKIYKIPKQVEFVGPVQKQRIAYKQESKTYTQKVPKIRTVPKTVEQTRQIQVPVPVLGMFGVTRTRTLRSTSTVHVQQSYLEDEQRTKVQKVPYTEYYTEDQKQTRIQEVDEEREEQVPVQKTRKKQMTRPKDLFKDQIRRKLNTTRLSNTKQLNLKNIKEKQIQVIQVVEKGEKFNLSYPTDIRSEHCKNEFQKQFIYIFKEIFGLEHQASAVNRPNVKINVNSELMLAD